MGPSVGPREPEGKEERILEGRGGTRRGSLIGLHSRDRASSLSVSIGRW